MRVPSLRALSRGVAVVALAVSSYVVGAAALAASDPCSFTVVVTTPPGGQPVIVSTCTNTPCDPEGVCHRQGGSDTCGDYEWCGCPGEEPSCCHLRLYSSFPPGQSPYGVGGGCPACPLPYQCKVAGQGTAQNPIQAACTNEAGYGE